MKAIGYFESLPITDERSLVELEVPSPTPGPRDLLVAIEAVSVNPVDTKVRANRKATPDAPVILGWDAAGKVTAIGAEVTSFRVGDEVYYAGSIIRPGSNAEYGVVDERIAGHKPKSLSFAQAAALPLTAITAWESLFDHLRVPRASTPSGDSILILGAAGGVGSIAVQLARTLTGLHVIGTASRPDSASWVRALGAHEVIDHTKPLAVQLASIGHPRVRYVLALTHSDQHWDAIVEVLAPLGEVCLTDDPRVIDVMKLKGKAGTLHLEMMFTRSMHQTPDMSVQHDLLEEVATMVDRGLLKTTLGKSFGRLSATNLRAAHASIEDGKSIGKVVLDGFGTG